MKKIQEVPKGAVRSAEELKRLDDLDLPPKTKNLIERKFGKDLEGIVYEGRMATFDGRRNHLLIIEDLVKALDAAGFIRHDLDPRVFSIYCRLYVAVYRKGASGRVHYRRAGLCPMDDRDVFNYHLGNKQYETFRNLGIDDLSVVLEHSLYEKMAKVIKLRFGLEGEAYSLKATAKRLDISFHYTYTLEKRALNKLKHGGQLLKIAAFKECDYGLPEINGLGLSVRAYDRLASLGVSSVDEIKSLSDESLLAVRGLGPKTLAEIREKSSSL